MSSTERRGAILQAASRLFEHYGHAKTTMADVAREAQIGVGTVYLEFASKEAIVEELSLSTHVGVLEAMRTAAERDRDCTRQLAAALMTRTDHFLELRRKGQHACELLHCKANGVQSAHQRFKEQERALLAEILDRGTRAATFTVVDAARSASLVQRAFASLTPPWLSGTDDEVRTVAIQLCDLLLRGLLARKPLPATRSKPRRR